MKCPLIGKNCIESKCAWWTTSTLRNIQTQEIYTESKCIVHVIPPMLVELIKNTGGVQTAIESSRNETIARQDQFLNLAAGRLLRGPQ